MKKTITYISIVVLFLVVGSFVFIFNTSKEYSVEKEGTKKVELIGDYYIDGKKVDNDIPTRVSGKNKTIIFKGKIKKTIEDNEKIIMHINNVKVKVSVNDKEIYSYAQNDQLPSYVKSGGNLWISFVTEGIKSTDDIRIEVTTVYGHLAFKGLTDFFDSLSYGYESDVVVRNMTSSLLVWSASILIFFTGVILLVISTILSIFKKKSDDTAVFALSSICAGLWFFIDYNSLNYIIPYPILTNTFYTIGVVLTFSFITQYFVILIKDKKRNFLLGMSGILLLFLGVGIVLQFTSNVDLYEFMPLIKLLIFIIVIASIYIIKNDYDNPKRYVLLILSTTLLIAITDDTILNYFGVISGIKLVQVWFILFVFLYFKDQLDTLRNILIENVKVKALQEIAYIDSLTGVGSRNKYFENALTLDRKINNKTAEFSIIVCDINNLKKTNDKYGHQMGDLMIVNAANIMKKCFENENIYRIGGDEFVIVLEKEMYQLRHSLVSKLKNEIKKYNANLNKEISISFAIGIDDFNSLTDKAYQQVFKRADKKMYLNKEHIKKKEITSKQISKKKTKLKTPSNKVRKDKQD